MLVYIQQLSVTKGNFLLKEYLQLLLTYPIIFIFIFIFTFTFTFNFSFYPYYILYTLNNLYCPVLLYLLYKITM